MRPYARRGVRQLAAAIDAVLPSTEHCSPTRANGMLAIVSLLGLGFAADAVAGNAFIVNTTGDSGPGSLRQAIASANASAGNTVQFDASLVGSTITLTAGEIVINKQMTIVGPGAGKLTVSGNNASRIFHLDSCPGTVPVYMSGLTLANGSSAFNGGAILVFGCKLNLAYSKIAASHSQNNGGGMYVTYDSALVVQHSTVTGNSATNGGGIGVSVGTTVSIQSSSIRGNTATYQGGGIFQLGGYLQVAYSTISGNVVPAPPGGFQSQGGGGVILSSAKFVSAGSTIANNYAYAGGSGVALTDTYSGDNTTIYSSTIAGNNSCCYETGNGITAASGHPTLDSDIVANNFSRAGSYDLAGSFHVYTSLVRNTGSATITGNLSIFGVDPKLSRLGDYGGPTQTMVPAAASPAVDAELTCFSFLAFDQRGLPRCVNGKVDMGAVERQSPEDLIFRDGFDSSG